MTETVDLSRPISELPRALALLQVMKACVVFLGRQARRAETVRRLAELRVALADVSDIHPHHLAWDRIAIDRSNRRWRSLLALAMHAPWPSRRTGRRRCRYGI